MPKVVGEDTSAAKRIIHNECGKIIEYFPEEIRVLWSGRDYSDGFDGAKGFTCPHCGENVITEAW